ncbi:MAG: large subunit ribosomal protein L30 [Polyangiales bacterium]|jgi:large subunit ribosomal protein L30
MTAKKLKITQLKSGIGRSARQNQTLRGLGLRGINKSVVIDNTPSFRGAVKKVLHLVSVEETNG